MRWHVIWIASRRYSKLRYRCKFVVFDDLDLRQSRGSNIPVLTKYQLFGPKYSSFTGGDGSRDAGDGIPPYSHTLDQTN